MLKDAGLAPPDVLRRARLPEDLFAREHASLRTEEYFRLWDSMAQEANDPAFGLRVASKMSAEVFEPPVFAALCSADLNTALERLSKYKSLIAPMRLLIDAGSEGTTLQCEWLDATEPPRSLIDFELMFFVQLARMGTRDRVIPIEVQSPRLLDDSSIYTEFLGVTPREGSRVRMVFSAEDASTPFLTANAKMWEFFEPELQRRLSELDEGATIAQRVQAALLELLPSGSASMESVSAKLGTSTRTLQRRLKGEGATFQQLLNRTREELARHYLKSSRMSSAEISFLLGFEDPNSFFRAFHGWTGRTPEQERASMRSEA